MFINNFDPVAFNIFSLEIRWYSLSYIFGIIFGWLYCKKRLIKNNSFQELFDDYIFYLILGIILGGRLGYVVIYNLNHYFNNPLEILMIWQGGMSFHGAAIGIILATYIFSMKKKISTFYFLDLVTLSAPIGIFFGRIANFINSELYGRESDVFWSVKFLFVDNLNRHPSQIYEAIFEGLILFIILNFLISRDGKKDGYVSAFFLIFYSIFRFLIEFTREPDAHIGLMLFNLSMGQLISIIFLLLGIFIWKSKKNV
jgi:phosphatidylglycerol:prolipoprotein diacylglycerol transferase|tara:strand:- start:1957 stop:2724 length:768 start_codon:yes stop_codon:yes gene_type:complete